MYRLVAAAVVALAAVGAAARVNASPREHHLPIPQPEAKVGQDFCSPITANFKMILQDSDVGQKLLEKGFVKTTDTFRTSRGPVKVLIRLTGFEVDNLDGVKRLGAGTLDKANNNLDCALKFPDLKISTRYLLVIPRNPMVPPQRYSGRLSLNANVAVNLSALVNSEGLLDELKSVSLRNDIAVSNFEAPQLRFSRYSSILTDILRDTMESSVAKIISDTVTGVLEEIVPNLSFETMNGR